MHQDLRQGGVGHDPLIFKYDTKYTNTNESANSTVFRFGLRRHVMQIHYEHYRKEYPKNPEDLEDSEEDKVDHEADQGSASKAPTGAGDIKRKDQEEQTENK